MVGLGVVLSTIGLLLVLWLTPLGWVLLGRINHEPFYLSRPTSYWRERLKAEDGSRPLRGLWQGVKDVITLADRSKTPQECLSAGGLEAVPVLLELLKDEDGFVRFLAAVSLSKVTSKKKLEDPLECRSLAKQLVPRLIVALKNEDSHFRVQIRVIASGILRTIGWPDAGEAVPEFIECLRDKDAAVRADSALALGTLLCEPEAAKEVIPSLIEAQSDRDPMVRKCATDALADIRVSLGPAR
jgi:HEAT repeat protein